MAPLCPTQPSRQWSAHPQRLPGAELWCLCNHVHVLASGLRFGGAGRWASDGGVPFCHHSHPPMCAPLGIGHSDVVGEGHPHSAGQDSGTHTSVLGECWSVPKWSRSGVGDWGEPYCPPPPPPTTGVTEWLWVFVKALYKVPRAHTHKADIVTQCIPSAVGYPKMWGCDFTRCGGAQEDS